MPGHVAATTFEDLGDGRTSVVTTSLFHTTEERDGMLSSGMELATSRGLFAAAYPSSKCSPVTPPKRLPGPSARLAWEATGAASRPYTRTDPSRGAQE